VYDIIIIGGGICGFSAAMYAGRLGLKTLVLEGRLMGGTITTTNIVENWPGIKKITGEDLAVQVIEHAKEYDIDVENEWVKDVKTGGKNGCFTISSEDQSYEGKTLILLGQSTRNTRQRKRIRLKIKAFIIVHFATAHFTREKKWL
jgi:thioredoxin reductase (NADPH)